MEPNIKIFGTLKSSEYSQLEFFVRDENYRFQGWREGTAPTVVVVRRILDDVSVLRDTHDCVANYSVEATVFEVAILKKTMRDRASTYSYSVNILEHILDRSS